MLRLLPTTLLQYLRPTALALTTVALPACGGTMLPPKPVEAKMVETPEPLETRPEAYITWQLHDPQGADYRAYLFILGPCVPPVKGEGTVSQWANAERAARDWGKSEQATINEKLALWYLRLAESGKKCDAATLSLGSTEKVYVHPHYGSWADLVEGEYFELLGHKDCLAEWAVSATFKVYLGKFATGCKETPKP